MQLKKGERFSFYLFFKISRISNFSLKIFPQNLHENSQELKKSLFLIKNFFFFSNFYFKIAY